MPQTRGLGAVRLRWCQALPAFPTEQRVLPAQFLTEGWLRRLPGASQCRSWSGESDCEALVECWALASQEQGEMAADHCNYWEQWCMTAPKD